MSPEQDPKSRQLFSQDARTALTFGAEEAQYLNHNYIGTEHMLWGIVRLAQVKDSKGAYKEIFSRLEITTDKVKSIIKFQEVRIGKEPVRKEQIGLSPRSKQVIQKAVDEVRAGNAKKVTPTLLLISLIEEKEGGAAHILNVLGIEEKHLSELKKSLDEPVSQVAHDATPKSDAELEAEAKIQRLKSFPQDI